MRRSPREVVVLAMATVTALTLAHAAPAAAAAVSPLPQDAVALEQRLLARLPARAGLCATNAGKEASQGEISEAAALAAARGCGPSLLNADLAALSFIVMMEAAKAAQEDMKSIMGDVKAINQAKQNQRQLGSARLAVAGAAMRGPCSDGPSCDQAALANSRDSLSDLSEQQQLQLQMATDRRTKALTLLSNMMRKIADTDATIIGNLK